MAWMMNLVEEARGEAARGGGLKEGQRSQPEERSKQEEKAPQQQLRAEEGGRSKEDLPEKQFKERAPTSVWGYGHRPRPPVQAKVCDQGGRGSGSPRTRDGNGAGDRWRACAQGT